LEPRGIVTSRSSELEDAMSGTAGRYEAPKGVRLCAGEKLCRVNPMSGTDPSGSEGNGGSKPSRGWKTLETERTGLDARVMWTSMPKSL